MYVGNTATITSNVSSNGTNTGALQVQGGVGIGGALNVGSYISANNGIYSVGTYTGVNYTDGIVVDYQTNNGRITVGLNDSLTFYTGNYSSSTTTATVQISTSGNVTIYSTTASNSAGTQGSLIVKGGAYVGGDLYISGTLNVNTVTGLASSATSISITNTTTSATQYIAFVSTTSGYTGIETSATGLTFIPSSGNFGIGTATPNYKLQVVGSFAATSKSFVINHPTRPGKTLRYGSLEGPENGVYVRGRVQTTVIDLPDYWTGLVDANSITVNLTPIGSTKMPSVERIENNQVFLTPATLRSKIDCFYIVFAERKDTDKLIVES